MPPRRGGVSVLLGYLKNPPPGEADSENHSQDAWRLAWGLLVG